MHKPYCYVVTVIAINDDYDSYNDAVEVLGVFKYTYDSHYAAEQELIRLIPGCHPECFDWTDRGKYSELSLGNTNNHEYVIRVQGFDIV